jgi:uncharacterized cysteine cluster protein YcgN (CxxCxxCC family)
MNLAVKPANQSWWESKNLSSMSSEEWESLCDGCGKCCLIKIQEAESERIFFTDVACQLLDCQTGLCLDYANRQSIVPDCVKLSKDNLDDLEWMPPDCAYRRLYEHKPLLFWHPLVSGNPNSTNDYGAGIAGMPLVSEREVEDDALEDHVVTWPLDRVG